MDVSTFLVQASPSSIHAGAYTAMVISKLRRDIYEFLIRRKSEFNESEDEYNEEFDLTKYLRIVDHENIEVVISELESIGWKTELAYGNTCLFIYVGEQPAKCRGRD